MEKLYVYIEYVGLKGVICPFQHETKLSLNSCAS